LPPLLALLLWSLGVPLTTQKRRMERKQRARRKQRAERK
jgi:hypothetical protein